MARYITCNNSDVTIQPYEPRLFEWNTPEGKAFFSTTVNRLLQAIGDNIVLDGLTCIATYNSDTITVNITPGYAIHSSTLIHIKTNYEVNLHNISGYDMNGFFIVYLDFQILRNTYEQKPAIGIAYVSDLGDTSIPWISSRYGLLLDIFQIKDGEVTTTEENFINIETKPYYKYGYDSSNMHLSKYISHFLKDLIINSDASIKFSGDVVVDNDLHVKGDIAVDNDIVISNDLEIAGDIEVKGGNTFLNTEITLIKDPLLKINVGEKSPDGISSNKLRISGLQIDRGYLQDAMLFFDETDDTWKIGFENETPSDLLTGKDITIEGLYPVVVSKNDYKCFYTISLNEEYLETLKNKISVFYNENEITDALRVIKFTSTKYDNIVTNENGTVNVNFDNLDHKYYIYESKSKESYIKINHNLNTEYICTDVYCYNYDTKCYVKAICRVIILDKNTISVKVPISSLLRIIISRVTSSEQINSSDHLYEDWVIKLPDTNEKLFHMVHNNMFSHNVINTIWKYDSGNDIDEEKYSNIIARDHIHLDSYSVYLFEKRKLMIINESFTDDNEFVFTEFYVLSGTGDINITHNLNSTVLDVYLHSHGRTIYACVNIIDENNIRLRLTEELAEFHVIILAHNKDSEREYVFESDESSETFEIEHNLSSESVRVVVWNMDSEFPELIIPKIIIDNSNKIIINMYQPHNIKVFIRSYY